MNELWQCMNVDCDYIMLHVDGFAVPLSLVVLLCNILGLSDIGAGVLVVVGILLIHRTCFVFIDSSALCVHRKTTFPVQPSSYKHLLV